MVSFGALDWAVVAVFAAGIFALGFSAKLRENSALQFIAAGRALTLPVFVATLVSSPERKSRRSCKIVLSCKGGTAETDWDRMVRSPSRMSMPSSRAKSDGSRIRMFPS